MSKVMLQLSVLSFVLVNVLTVGGSFAAPVSQHAGLFDVSEVSGLSTGHGAELAAKCGTGACGGKEAKPKEDTKALWHQKR
jgi:hypothetical protein